jgi:hypothetical protein
MKLLVWRESRNLAADRVFEDGRRIKAQNYATSTMKWKNGRVHKILKKFFEVARQVLNCRCAAENDDMPEFDWDFDDTSRKCGCHAVKNGFWPGEAGQPGPERTLEDVCRGRLYRSRGHRSYGEVIQLFRQNDKETWEAQQECSEAESSGNYVKSFSRERHGLQSFPIDPANGPFYEGVDWGDTNPACVLVCQYLQRAVRAMRYDGERILIPRGSRVLVGEIYKTGITAAELGQQTIVLETRLAANTTFRRVPVRKRFADVQGAGSRRDWRKLGLKTHKYSTRNFDEQVKEVRGMYDAMRAFVVVDACPHYADEIEGWHEDEAGNEVEVDNHAMAAGRYLFYGMHDVYGDSGANDPETQRVVEAARASADSGPSVVQAQEIEDELDWRAGLGYDNDAATY